MRTKRRYENQEKVQAPTERQPRSGKKGGEVAKTGHGPSTREKQDEGGKSKDKKKSD